MYKPTTSAYGGKRTYIYKKKYSCRRKYSCKKKRGSCKRKHRRRYSYRIKGGRINGLTDEEILEIQNRRPPAEPTFRDSVREMTELNASRLLYEDVLNFKKQNEWKVQGDQRILNIPNFPMTATERTKTETIIRLRQAIIHDCERLLDPNDDYNSEDFLQSLLTFREELEAVYPYDSFTCRILIGVIERYHELRPPEFIFK